MEMRTTINISYICDKCGKTFKDDDQVYGFLHGEEIYYLCKDCFDEYIKQTFKSIEFYKKNNTKVKVSCNLHTTSKSIPICYITPLHRVMNRPESCALVISDNILDLTDVNSLLDIEYKIKEYFAIESGSFEEVKSTLTEKLNILKAKLQEACKASNIIDSYTSDTTSNMPPYQINKKGLL